VHASRTLQPTDSMSSSLFGSITLTSVVLQCSAVGDQCAGEIGIHQWPKVSLHELPNVTILARMYERRLRGYADMGYKITGGLQEHRASFEIAKYAASLKETTVDPLV
jgi:hypothetical protein